MALNLVSCSLMHAIEVPQTDERHFHDHKMSFDIIA